MNDARTSSTKFGSVKRSRYAPHHFCRFVSVTSEIRLILTPIKWPKLHRWSTCIIYLFPSNMLQQFGGFFSSFLHLWHIRVLEYWSAPTVSSSWCKPYSLCTQLLLNSANLSFVTHVKLASHHFRICSCSSKKNRRANSGLSYDDVSEKIATFFKGCNNIGTLNLC